MIDPLNTLPDLSKKERYNKKNKIAVALSGGIDSTASAILLKEAGCEVVGLFMQLYDSSLNIPTFLKACFGPSEPEKIEHTRLICKALGIPLYLIDLRKDFREYVIGYFRNEYLSGKTPNPCIRCNLKIKFELLPKKAKERGIEFDLFATGHYARLGKIGDRYILKKGYDNSKDQSYFLYALVQEQLSSVTFPVGDYKKERLRSMVSSLGLGIEKRKESQDFISEGSYSVLFREPEIKEGPIMDRWGKRLGTHKGIIYYTVGQRKGLGISSSRPFYVIEIDAKNNTIIVGHKEDLFSDGLIAGNINLITMEKMDSTVRAKVKIRQQHKGAKATLYPMGDRIRVIFDEPQLAVTPGQSAVFYSQDVVLGGGIIELPIKGE